MLARELAKVAGPAGVRLLTPLLDEAAAEQERGRRGGRDLCSLRRVDRPLAFFCAKSVNHAMARLSTGGRVWTPASKDARPSVPISVHFTRHHPRRRQRLPPGGGPGLARFAAGGRAVAADHAAWEAGRSAPGSSGMAARSPSGSPMWPRRGRSLPRSCAASADGEGRPCRRRERRGPNGGSRRGEPCGGARRNQVPGRVEASPVAPHAQIAASGILHQSRRSTADPRNGSHLGDPGLNGALDHVQMRRSWRSSGHQGPLARGRARPLPPF